MSKSIPEIVKTKNTKETINKSSSRNNTKQLQIPVSQKSTIEGTPSKEEQNDNELDIKSSSSSLSHISNLLSKKKLTYSQICNNLPYHNTENNFVYNMISSRNSNRIDKVNDMMSNMRNSFEMMSLKNSMTATTGYNNNSNNHSNNKGVKVSCCFFSKK